MGKERTVSEVICETLRPLNPDLLHPNERNPGMLGASCLDNVKGIWTCTSEEMEVHGGGADAMWRKRKF